MDQTQRRLVAIAPVAGDSCGRAVAFYSFHHGRPWPQTGVRAQLRRLALQAGVRRRFAPHQLRHAHAVEMAREGVPLNVIQRQLEHSNLGVTSVYLQGIDSAEVVNAIHDRRAPLMPATAGLKL